MQKTDTDRVVDIITPSISSGTIAVIVSGITVGFSVITSYGKNSSLQQSIFGARDFSSPTYHQVIDSLAKNAAISNAPLFLFWLAIGLIVYFIAINIIKAFGSGVNLVEELEYVNVKPSRVIRYEVFKALARGAVLASWLLYLHVFIRVILPYALAQAYNAHLSSAASEAGHILLSFIVLAAAIQLHIVLLRLLLLKRRVFKTKYSID